MVGKCTLMHKDNPVCALKFSQSGFVEEVFEIYDKTLLPPSVNPEVNINFELTKWMDERCFNKNRTDIMAPSVFLPNTVFNKLGAISLFDCYWFKTNQSETWDSVNAFDNWSHQKDPIVLMNIDSRYINKNYIKNNPVFNTPNFTIPGAEQRIWIKKDDDFYLLNTNLRKEMNIYKNNKLSSIVQKRFYTIIKNCLFCAKKTQTSKNIEAFPLEGIYNRYANLDDKDFNNVLNACEAFGIPKEKTIIFLQKLFEVDENAKIEDRDFSSVYLLRDSNTLKAIGFEKI